MSDRKQSPAEERANTITHGLGILFSLVAVPFMIFYAAEKGTASTVWGVSVFGFGMLMVYFSSTIYHAVEHISTKRMLRVWDHISIFLLIGGSYTPLIIKFTDEATAKLFLITMWSIIAVGSVLKLFFTGKYKKIELALYLFLGGMALFIIKPLTANIPPQIFKWILAGGFFYLSGVVFYVWKKLHYHHAVWHCFVLAGTVTHFFAVYNSIPIHMQL
jgi:hemolysin III